MGVGLRALRGSAPKWEEVRLSGTERAMASASVRTIRRHSGPSRGDSAPVGRARQRCAPSVLRCSQQLSSLNELQRRTTCCNAAQHVAPQNDALQPGCGPLPITRRRPLCSFCDCLRGAAAARDLSLACVCVHLRALVAARSTGSTHGRFEPFCCAQAQPAQPRERKHT